VIVDVGVDDEGLFVSGDVLSGGLDNAGAIPCWPVILGEGDDEAWRPEDIKMLKPSAWDEKELSGRWKQYNARLSKQR
jgi:hypothetical protein